MAPPIRPQVGGSEVSTGSGSIQFKLGAIQIRVDSIVHKEFFKIPGTEEQLELS